MMEKFIMLSKLTDEGRKTVKMRPERIKEVNDEIEKMGAKVIEQYAVLGEFDFINILEAPDNETISRVSIELGARGTIQLITLAAISIEELQQTLNSSSINPFALLIQLNFKDFFFAFSDNFF